MLVLFDGQCGLCDVLVRGLIRRDRQGRLVFAAQQSEAGKHWMERSGAGPETVVAIAGWESAQPRVLVRSSAVLAAGRLLPMPWSLLAAVGQRVPAGLRDAAYRLIARLRHRIWGRRQRCPLLIPADRNRFLE